jgi:hypothetical protein
MIRPFDVPPRTNDAGNDFVVILAALMTGSIFLFDEVGIHFDPIRIEGRSRLFTSIVSKMLNP